MINVKTSRNMFMIRISTQADNNNLKKNFATDKIHILFKMSLKFSKPKVNIFEKYHYVFFHNI